MRRCEVRCAVISGAVVADKVIAHTNNVVAGAMAGRSLIGVERRSLGKLSTAERKQASSGAMSAAATSIRV